ncbi:hypothetical protein C0J52_28352 [Blattella germanica]|nr:hypothetical protein C0J52_28352 [Blattella germanica]
MFCIVLHLRNKEDIFLLQISPLTYIEEDTEVVYLKRTLISEVFSDVEASSFDDKAELEYEFTAFARPISLRLRPNRNLLAPNFRIYKQFSDNWREQLILPSRNCHYLQNEGGVIAALSNCHHPYTLVRINNFFSSVH